MADASFDSKEFRDFCEKKKSMQTYASTKETENHQIEMNILTKSFNQRYSIEGTNACLVRQFPFFTQQI